MSKFGIKQSTRHRLMGIKKGLHNVNHIGTKILSVVEVMQPELIPELEASKAVLRKIDKITK
jgi:hypothetical protein